MKKKKKDLKKQYRELWELLYGGDSYAKHGIKFHKPIGQNNKKLKYQK